MVTKIKSNIAKLGFIATLFYSIHKVLNSLHRSCGVYYYYFYEQSLEPLPATDPRKKVFDFYWLTEVNDQILTLPRPESVIRNRFLSGSECLAVNKDSGNEFLGCAWFAFKRYQEDEVNCIYDFSMAANKVWDYDVYITPEQRMSRLFLRLWQQASGALNTRGFNASLSRISAYNAQSISSHEKLGATRLGWAVFFKLPKAQLMISDQTPFVSLNVGLKKQPVLVFK